MLLLGSVNAPAQQQADTTFRPVVAQPAFAPGAGPVVLVDEAHHNFHTADGWILDWVFADPY